MRAIYNGCILDPWLEVAKKLYTENNIEPIYWIGWNRENEEKSVKSEFPHIIFQDLADSWKGIFSKNVNDIEAAIDNKFLEKNAFHELIALKMMDRMDPDGKCFTFNERQRHYRLLLKKWLGIIDKLKPDLLISPNIPHRIYDYVLYVACQARGVKIITYRHTHIPGLLIPVTDIYALPQNIFEFSRSRKDINLSAKTKADINKARQIYEMAKPHYIKKHKNTLNYFSIISLIKRFFSEPAKHFKFILNIFQTTKNGYKKKNQETEKSRFSFFEIEMIRWQGRRYKRKLKKYYDSLTTHPDLSKNFIFVALHYQPEATSSPLGGVYVDQFLMIDLLSKSIPEDWLIYVKEHSSQFHPLSEGEASRNKSFYRDIVKLKNTRLVPDDFDTFKLIDHCQAVATLTGTVGFEATVRKKPVLAFGVAWYAPLSSVFEIKDGACLKEALKKIKDGLEIDSIELLSYLSHIEKNIGIYAYHYKGEKETANITKEETIKSLIQSILSNL